MKPTIFFAIPCGGFFDEQRKIIERVCDAAKIDESHRIIIEDERLTNDLWLDIIEKIEHADYFVADVSSQRPNIILELGYALKAKHRGKVAFFVSKNVDVPSDLGGQKRHDYSSFHNFQEQLIEWMKQALGIPSGYFAGIVQQPVNFTEDFKDREKFLRLWSTPPGCQYNLTSEGLQFTNADFPVLTQTLDLLVNLEFTFKARIVRECVGWVIRGTVKPRHILPSFCMMFNLSTAGELRTHILNIQKSEKPIYHECERIQTQLNLEDRCFGVSTQYKDDQVIIKIDEAEVFRRTLKTDSKYSEFYEFEPKRGQVGFRCAGWDTAGEWGEIAVVGDVKVTEIE